jgi:hypothetical protein
VKPQHRHNPLGRLLFEHFVAPHQALLWRLDRRKKRGFPAVVAVLRLDYLLEVDAISNSDNEAIKALAAKYDVEILE